MIRQDVVDFLRSSSSADFNQYVVECQEPFEATLTQLVGFRSVSPGNECREEITACIERAKSLVECLGGESRLIDSQGGTPVLFWKYIKNPSWPTVILYNHLDVMPVKQDNDFQLRIVQKDDGNRYYYGRGAADNKGPALVGLLSINYAIKHELPINFIIIWETEEEIGSDHFVPFLETVEDELLNLSSPFLLVSDTNWQDPKVPTITSALRGLVKFIFELKTAVYEDENGNIRPKENHSGAVGSAAPNPITRLMYVLTRCVGPDGTINIPEFYDGVNETPDKELDLLISRKIFTTGKFKETHGLVSLTSDDPKEILHRIWDRPTLEITGFHSGTTVIGSVKSSVPGVAHAWVSMRVGIGQDGAILEEKLRNFVASIDPAVSIIRIGGIIPPILFNTEEEHFKTAVNAFKEGYGYKETVFDRCGGSIGSVVDMSRAIPNLKVLLMGTSRPDDNAHADNENYDWVQASGGIRTFVRLFDNLTK